MAKRSFESINGVVRLHNGSRSENPTQVRRDDRADEGSLPSVTGTDCPSTIWPSVTNYLIESFAICGASLYPAALSPVEVPLTETKIRQQKKVSPPEPRGFMCLVPPLVNPEGAATEHGPTIDRFARGEAMPFENAPPPGRRRLPSLKTGPSSRWNWLTSFWKSVVALWAHACRKQKIKRTVAALAELDDRTLRDMGIPHRSGIEQVVRYGRDF
jgi:uncharacterized protein YjiS (DUF1127 family)